MTNAVRRINRFLSLLIFLSASVAQSLPLSFPQGKLAHHSGETITTYIAISEADKKQGLSGITDQQMKENEALFFYYKNKGPRSFWMINTFMDLDIFFLDDNLKVLKVYRNMKAHPGYQNRSTVMSITREIATHVLELRADSKISKKIKEGDQLKWIPAFPLSPEELETRLQQ